MKCVSKGTLKRILAAQFSQLGAEELLRLSRGLEDLSTLTQGHWRWASACSGSDVVYLALEALHGLWKSRMGSVPEIGHAFSCEDVKFKQEWIKTFFAPDHIFPDIHFLKGDSVQDIDGNDVSDLSCDAFIAGVECDSISALNRDRSQNFDCAIEEASGQPTRTGDTARSAMGFLEKRRPPLAIFENVKQLACAGKSGQSNLDWLISRASQLGYHVVHMALSALSFGVPQQRDRMYIICVFVGGTPHQSKLGHDESTPVEAEPGWVHDLRAFIHSMNIPSLDLHEFLLPDSDPEVASANAALCQPAPAKKLKRKRVGALPEDGGDLEAGGKGATANVMKFEVEHLEFYSQAKVAWPPALPEAFVAKASCLPRRMQEILFLEERLFGPAESLKTLRCRDLNMTMGWGKWRESGVPCVVSSAALWLRGPRLGGTIDRLLCGKELLQLQGFDAHRQESPHVFAHKDKVDLAGNAFCAPILLAVVSAVVACVDWQVAWRAKDHAARPAVASPEPQPASPAPQESLDGDSLYGEEEGGESEEPEVDLEVETDSGASVGSMLG